jgi:hypothetical protein
MAVEGVDVDKIQTGGLQPADLVSQTTVVTVVEGRP